jgi:type II secretory pathway component PulF
MRQFTYKAINDSGEMATGTLEADSIDAANNILTARGLIPTKVAQKGGSGGSAGSLSERLATVRAPELILFTKQFRTMLKAGISIVNLLEIIESQTENPKLKHVLSSMARDIAEGISLHEAFRKHPNVFSPLYCSMVRAGESSGALPDVLERLTYIIEHENKVKQDIKAALQYPIIVICFLFVAFLVLLTFVIPKFAAIFVNAGVELPLPTQICISLYNFLDNYWYILLAGLAGVIFALVAVLRTHQGLLIKDMLLMKLPIIGPLFVKTAMSRFASIFSILQASGIAVLDAMDILSGTIGNVAISQEFVQLKDKLEEGRGIAGPLKAAKYFTPMVVTMVAVGEESGNLDEMLREVAVHYDTEVEYAMGKMSEAIGPILMVGLAAMVGFFALAIFLPMWDMAKIVK